MGGPSCSCPVTVALGAPSAFCTAVFAAIFALLETMHFTFRYKSQHLHSCTPRCTASPQPSSEVNCSSVWTEFPLNIPSRGKQRRSNWFKCWCLAPPHSSFSGVRWILGNIRYLFNVDWLSWHWHGRPPAEISHKCHGAANRSHAPFDNV